MNDIPSLRALALCAALLAWGCGTSQTCLDIVKEYAQEKDNALVCDPASADPCSDQAPVVISGIEADGGLSVEGLASNCNHAINPARSAKLHEILGHFQASGCVAQPVPGCQAVVNRCIQGATGPTCAP